jgi:hypothetical protein
LFEVRRVGTGSWRRDGEEVGGIVWGWHCLGDRQTAIRRLDKDREKRVRNREKDEGRSKSGAIRWLQRCTVYTEVFLQYVGDCVGARSFGWGLFILGGIPTEAEATSGGFSAGKAGREAERRWAGKE